MKEVTDAITRPSEARANARLNFDTLDGKVISLFFHAPGAEIAARDMNNDLAREFADAVRYQVAGWLEQRIPHMPQLVADNRVHKDSTPVVYYRNTADDSWKKNGSDASLLLGGKTGDRAGIKFLAPGAALLLQDTIGPNAATPKSINLHNKFAQSVRDVIQPVLEAEMKTIVWHISVLHTLGAMSSFPHVLTQQRRMYRV